jgi:hypothetical protein
MCCCSGCHCGQQPADAGKSAAQRSGKAIPLSVPMTRSLDDDRTRITLRRACIVSPSVVVSNHLTMSAVR